MRQTPVTVDFEVEMRMFMKGVIRKVTVPTQELSNSIGKDLDRIFFYGQNDIQPLPDKCSVSMGDVIRYRGDRYLILDVGFRKLAEGECTKPLNSVKRIMHEVLSHFRKEKHEVLDSSGRGEGGNGGSHPNRTRDGKEIAQD